ncbi:MAG: M48 family metallopeptidase [Kofleriaceae bacterium]
MKIVFAIIAIAGCSHPQYLGARVPKPCTAKDAEGCVGWMAERDLAAAELDIYEDAELRRYIQSVANRIAKASTLEDPPRVVLADHDDTYATTGRRIVIARQTIEKLASEAELAAVIAHELAHVEGRHSVVSLFGRPPDENFINRRDAESIADERAVWLLERAGYTPTAMANALRAVLEAEDEEHPLRAERIARVNVLAGNRAGEIGREAFLQHLTNMVVGRDTRRGHRSGDAWVISALGIAFQLDGEDTVRGDADVLALRRDRTVLVAYAVGAPWGRELASTLEGREVVPSDVGTVTMGTIPFPVTRTETPLAKLARAVRNSLPQPAAGSRVAILVRLRGALVVEIGGRATPSLTLRIATDREIADAEPPRVAITHAPRAGTIAELGVCAKTLLDDPTRKVASGEPIKCATR